MGEMTGRRSECPPSSDVVAKLRMDQQRGAGGPCEASFPPRLSGPSESHSDPAGS